MFSKLPFKLLALCIAAALAYHILSGKSINEGDFVGTWQSSRTLTPLILSANGEWEIRTPEGSVLQYGIWRYERNRIIWTIKQGGGIATDINPVLSVSKDSFELREQDGSTTRFRRLL